MFELGDKYYFLMSVKQSDLSVFDLCSDAYYTVERM